MADQIGTDLERLTLESSTTNAAARDRETKAIFQNDSKHLCIVCATPAKLCCTGCQTIPTISKANDERRGTWYCSKKCQIQDWPNHKTYCKEIGAKLDFLGLQRATKLLRALFNTYRSTTFDQYIKSVVRQGDILYIEDDECNVKNHLLTIFPGFEYVESMWSDPGDRETILAMMSCGDPLIPLHECCALFLRDTKIAKTITEVGIELIPGRRVWVYKRDWTTQTSDQMTGHSMDVVTLNNGTQWAVDLTSAQYGHIESLTPWDEYLKKRIQKVVKTFHFGYSHKVYETNIATPMSLSTMGVNMDGVVDINKKIQWTQYKISEVIKPSIQTILKDHGLTPRDFIRRSPEAEFERISQEIIDTVRAAMQELKKEMDQVEFTIEKMRVVKKHVAMAARVVLREEDLPPVGPHNLGGVQKGNHRLHITRDST